MLKSYPKVHALGKARYIKELFNDPVEITEKLDGSQFKFGLVDGNLMCCTKGSVLDLDTKDKLFKPAVETCKKLYNRGLINDNYTYFAETLCKPKHNTLTYDNVPKGNIALFAAYSKQANTWLSHASITGHAAIFDIDVVKLLFSDYIQTDNTPIDKQKLYDNFLKTTSQLSGTPIEGFVIKNLYREAMIGGTVIPFIQAKFVSDEFKEKHESNYTFKSSSSSWDAYKERYRTEARWNKSIQHLRDEGKLLDSPVDIGKLMTAIKEDITDECKDEIVKFLWNHFGKDLLRKACHGFPEHYKKYLLEED